MVGLLWVGRRPGGGDTPRGVLERPAARDRLSLFCAYPIDIYDDGDTAGLDAVLGAHTHMSVGPNTMLSTPRGLR